MSKAIVPWVINGNMGQAAMVKDTQNVVKTVNTTIWIEKKKTFKSQHFKNHTAMMWTSTYIEMLNLSPFTPHTPHIYVHNISSSWQNWKSKCIGKVQKVKVCGSFIFDETTKVTREKTFPPSPNLCLRRTLFGFMVNKMSN